MQNDHPQHPNICPYDLARWKYLRFFACILGYRSDLHSSVWGFAARVLLRTRSETGVALCKHACLHAWNSTNKLFGNLKFPCPSSPLLQKWLSDFHFISLFYNNQYHIQRYHISQLELPWNKEIKATNTSWYRNFAWPTFVGLLYYCKEYSNRVQLATNTHASIAPHT